MTGSGPRPPTPGRLWPAMTLPSRTETKAKPFGPPTGDHNTGHREEK